MIIDFCRASIKQTRTWSDLVDAIVEECGYSWRSTGFADFAQTQWGIIFHFDHPKFSSQATSVEIDEPAYLMLKLKYYGRIDFNED